MSEGRRMDGDPAGPNMRKNTHTQDLFLLFHAYAGLFKDVQYMGVKMS